MIRLLTFTLSFIALSCVFALPGRAADHTIIGHIAAIEGQATLSRNGTSAPSLSEGADIYMGDILETGADAKLMISFVDESSLTVGNDARLVIDEYVYSDSAPDTNKARFSMLRGAFEFGSGLIAKTKKTPDVEFNTAYGSIGIRGTLFWGGVIKRQSKYSEESRMAGSEEQFGIYVKKGAVELMAENGTVRVDEGYGTFMKTPDSRPSEPKIWTEDEIRKAAATVAFADKP